MDYEADLVQMANWADMKASGVCPFGYLPLITLEDGTAVNETVAQCMAVGKIAGTNGDSAADFGMSAMLCCKAAEVFTEFAKHNPTMFTVRSPEALPRADLCRPLSLSLSLSLSLALPCDDE
eukprot:SAG22_NODE_8088_length_684_cov_1.447863_1_plen_122_part_00